MSITKLDCMELKDTRYSVYPYDGYNLEEILGKFYEAIKECNDLSFSLQEFNTWLIDRGLLQEVEKQLTNVNWDKVINSELYQKVIDDLGITNEKIDKLNKTFLASKVNESVEDCSSIINTLLEDSIYLSFEGLKEVRISSPIVIKQPNTILDLSGCKIIPNVEMESIITTECISNKHIYNIIIQNGELDCNYKANYGIYTKKSYKSTIRNIRINNYKTGIKLNDETIPNGNEFGYSYETLVDNVICGNITQVANSVGIEVTASDSWVINSVFGGEVGLWSHDNAVNFYDNIHCWNTGQKIGIRFQNTVGNIISNIEADDSLECGMIINNEYNTIQNYTFQVGATTHPLSNELGTTAIKILQGYNYIDGMTVIIPTNAQIESIFAGKVPNTFYSKNITLKGLIVQNQGVIKNGTLYKEGNANTFSTAKYYSAGWQKVLKFDCNKFTTLDGYCDYPCGRWIGKIVGDRWAVDNLHYAEIAVSFLHSSPTESGVKILTSNYMNTENFRIVVEDNIAYLELYNDKKEHYHIISTYNLGVEEIRQD